MSSSDESSKLKIGQMFANRSTELYMIEIILIELNHTSLKYINVNEFAFKLIGFNLNVINIGSKIS